MTKSSLDSKLIENANEKVLNYHKSYEELRFEMLNVVGTRPNELWLDVSKKHFQNLRKMYEIIAQRIDEEIEKGDRI